MNNFQSETDIRDHFSQEAENLVRLFPKDLPFPKLPLKHQLRVIKVCVMRMVEGERIARLENEVQNISNQIEDMSADIRQVGTDVLAIKLALARQSGAKSILNWAVNLTIGIIGVAAGLWEAHK